VNGPFAWFKWLALFHDWPIFAQGLGITLLASALALALSLALGVMFGVFGASIWKIPKAISRIYVEFIQNTPLVIQIFFLYNGLPHVGIKLPILTLGVIGIGVYHGAYIAEVVRAGIDAVPRGQKEAAFSQGFTFWATMRHIVLPQAKNIVLPPLTNQAVNLIKNTSVLAIVAGGDLMYHADSWASNNLYYGPAYAITGLLYLAVCFPLATFAKALEHRTGVKAA
jgi:putative glutamine transport system permease protein